MDKVVHFEIPMDDAARAKEFYGSIFGWEIQSMEEFGYTLVTTTPVDQTTMTPAEPGAINGGMMARDALTPAPVITIGVDSIDDALERIEQAGGSTVTPRTAMGGAGAFAYFKDSEGNVLGLWETT